MHSDRPDVVGRSRSAAADGGACVPRLEVVSPKKCRRPVRALVNEGRGGGGAGRSDYGVREGGAMGGAFRIGAHLGAGLVLGVPPPTISKGEGGQATGISVEKTADKTCSRAVISKRCACEYHSATTFPSRYSHKHDPHTSNYIWSTVRRPVMTNFRMRLNML